MSARVNPFANITDAPAFETKPKPVKPVAKETIEQIARDNNFPSRQAAKTPHRPQRKRRIHRTGRDQHFGIKATAETVDRFYKLADERRVTLGELLEHALDALEKSDANVVLSTNNQLRNRAPPKDL
jgi:hypothetical protein